MRTSIMLTSARRKMLKSITALFVALAGVTTVAQANLIPLGPLIDFLPGEDPHNPADEAAALNRQFHSGPLIYLGRIVFRSNGVSFDFIPGAIRDPSQLSFRTSDGLGFFSWDLTGTGFQARFLIDNPYSFDFEEFYAAGVTPDEFLNSRGEFIFGSGTRITLFGNPITTPDWGSTALLLSTALLILGIGRGFVVKGS